MPDSGPPPTDNLGVAKRRLVRALGLTVADRLRSGHMFVLEAHPRLDTVRRLTRMNLN